MNKQICVLLLLAGILTSCGIKTETMSPEERAESYRLMEESCEAAESESLRLEQEDRKAEAKKKAEAETKAMAAQDFEENRYTTFQGVDYLPGDGYPETES